MTDRVAAPSNRSTLPEPRRRPPPFGRTAIGSEPRRYLFGVTLLPGRSLKNESAVPVVRDARTARQFPLESACSMTLEYDDSPMLKLIWSYTSPSNSSSNTPLKRSESCWP